MEISHFCFVLVLVSVSASYYDEELPLYLSDDILISQFPRISKRSTSDHTKPVEEIHINDDKKGSLDVDEGEIENGEESGLVFIPSFGRRFRRSLSSLDQHQVKTINQRDPDEEVSNNKDNQNNKEKKHGGDPENASESGLVFLPSFGRRNRRSAVEKEDLDILESNIVFLPSFRRNGFRRFRRDIDNAHHRYYSKRSADTLTKNEKKTSDALTTERNEELSDSDAVNGQESGLVFLPSFGRRSRRSAEERTGTHNQQKGKQDTSTNSGQKEKSTQKVKGTLNASHKTKRGVSTEKPEKTNADHSSDKNTEDEIEEESGLVFIPSFGRRYRRDTSSETSVKKEKTNSSPTKNEEVSKKTFSTQESGLVFLPTFNRRTRREVSSVKLE